MRPFSCLKGTVKSSSERYKLIFFFFFLSFEDQSWLFFFLPFLMLLYAVRIKRTLVYLIQLRAYVAIKFADTLHVYCLEFSGLRSAFQCLLPLRRDMSDGREI